MEGEQETASKLSNGTSFNDLEWPLTFQGHGVTIDAFDVLCSQLTRGLFAIAKFLFCCFIVATNFLVN